MPDYPKPEGLEEDALSDAMYDLQHNGFTTLDPKEDPEKWIHWLTRYRGFYTVSVHSHTSVALILEGF